MAYYAAAMRPILLLALLLPACSDYDLEAHEKDPEGDAGDDSGGPPADTDDLPEDSACSPSSFPPVAVDRTDACDDYEIGGFTPIVEWDVPGEASTALPVVADLTGDGLPEVVANWSWGLGNGTLAVYAGDGSGELWRDSSANLGYGSHPAVADLDDDGVPEILVVRASMFDQDGVTIAAYSYDGQELWESEPYSDEFDYATGISVSDMDHDGSPEIVAGSAILNADGSPRGEGRYGRGCPADGGFVKEGAQTAVVDLDLDGVEEVVAGDAIYDPDGDDLWRGTDGDGGVSVANLDDDPEGEFVVVSWNEIRAHDTDGSILWGPLANRTANIFPIAAIGDVDNDGAAEIVVAGGDELWVLNNDGSLLWTAPVHDMSGATGASLFDFDADGILEVVYIDEVQMVAYNGTDGVVKFQTNEHASATMYDYPVIADVDADGHAEIVVAHDMAYGAGLSVYGDVNDSWAPARKLWNQHAYSIVNVNDDLSIPTTAAPNFTVYNNYHAAQALPPGTTLQDELESEILEVCQDDCDDGVLWVTARARNTGIEALEPGVKLALYAISDAGRTLLGTAETTAETPAGMTTEAVVFAVDAADVADATSLYLVADDDGTGTGHIAECVEDNNEWSTDGPFCR